MPMPRPVLNIVAVQAMYLRVGDLLSVTPQYKPHCLCLPQFAKITDVRVRPINEVVIECTWNGTEFRKTLHADDYITIIPLEKE